VKALSLFSGAGGLDMGLEGAGFEVQAQVEIDPHAASVLRYHWPHTEHYPDVTTYNARKHRGRVAIVAGGSPCQDLSIAGRRSGLDGSRSGLFWHQCRVADEAAAPWVLWENVNGALTSGGGADFAAVLWGLTGTLPFVPDGGWRTSGVVVGPKRWAVWRVVDAQFFGVAQRRRRIFVVAGPRGLCAPEILLEPASLRGDPRPRRQARQGAPTGAGPGAAPDAVTYAADIANPLTARDAKGPPTRLDNGEGNVVAVPVTLNLLQAPIHEADGSMALSSGAMCGVLEPGAEMVRRLTPRECERLMGWPDDWTRWTDAGTELADTHRYRLCGNGVVAPVAEWVAARIMAAAT
jgi:DNA (cytosine-5)-methyltransferase 1